MASLTFSAVLCLILLTGAKSDDEVFSLQETSEFTESTTPFEKLETTTLPGVETTVVQKIETIFPKITTLEPKVETTTVPEAETTTVPEAETTTVPEAETTEIPEVKTAQIPLEDQNADFEKLVYAFVERLSEYENKSIEWFNFYAPPTTVIEDFSLLKPRTIDQIKIPSLATWNRSFVYDMISNIKRINESILYNDNDFACSYNLEVPFYLSHYTDVTPLKSVKPSSWFHDSVNYLSELFRSHNDFHKYTSRNKKTIQGSYKADLEPNQSLKVYWNVVWKDEVYALKLNVSLYGHIVIALNNGNNTEYFDYPISDLADDSFVSTSDGLNYSAEAYFIYTIPNHVIGEAVASPDLKTTKYGVGTLTVKKL